MTHLIYSLLALSCFIFSHTAPLYANPFNDEELKIIDMAARTSGAAYAQSFGADTAFLSGAHYNKIKTNLSTDAMLSEFTEIGPDDTVAHTLIATTSDTVYVAFPGCTDGCSGFVNLCRWNTIYNGRECHGGIPLYYSPIREKLLKELQRLQDGGKKRFVFTGHCSGGAKASLAMADFLDQRNLPQDISVKLITFASTPSVFPPNVVAAIKSNSQYKGHHDIWLDNDFWRRPSGWFDWARGTEPLGPPIVLKGNSNTPFLERHRLRTYLTSVLGKRG